MKSNQNYEIIWHGRGGQGAVTAAKMFTEAAYYSGFKGVSAKPTYFSERRGAPVSVHTRISPEPIRTFSNVLFPDIAVVLDDNLLEMVNVTSNLKTGGLLVINSSKSANDLNLQGQFKIAISDAYHCSEEAGLIIEGNVLVSTSILGPLVAATNFVSMENVRKAIEKKFKGKSLERNIKALDLAFQRTEVSEIGSLSVAAHG
ncbi:MAG: 2-oxoacid:acceptor oxidoreductase family protein [Desulfomonilaceae bacterium]|jgi:2-oxoacid:acceptor oxidoreductase gamma subunit (pyruvate/2-ketoisovalerate family)